MKRTLFASGLLGLLVGPAVAQISPDEFRDAGAAHDHVARSDYDIRYTVDYPSDRVRGVAGSSYSPFLLREREAHVREFAERVPGLKVDYDPIFGTPRFVRSPFAFLTSPSPIDAAAVVEGFLVAHRPMFGIGLAEVEDGRVSRDYVTEHNGVRHLEWQQQIDGVDLFGARLRANVTSDGRLINISSTMLPRPAEGFQVAPVSKRPLEAIRAAAQSVDIAMTVDPEPVSVSGDRIEWSQTPDFRSDRPLRTELVVFPLDAETLVPAWFVEIPEHGVGNNYASIIDARNGQLLWRYNNLKYLRGGTLDASFRVFTADSPAPASPGPATPSATQLPEVARQLVTVTAGSITPFSPDGWIPDTGSETLGNNVDAHTDINADNLPDLPRPNGGAFRIFDFAADLTQDPSTYQNASVTNLFYHCNVFHDRLYELGFDEAAGNYQTDNFGNGGVGGDPIQADAQDTAFPTFNNANFAPSFDGDDGRVQMFLWNGPTPLRDGDFDAQIIYHELGHGLSHRLVGPFTLGGEQSGGMGEGWSDFYGITLVAEPTDDINGTYPMGPWTTFLLPDTTGTGQPPLQENFYFGIRRFPYSTDIATVNPITYADTDPAQNAYPPGIPQNPNITNNPDAVHKVGEVWCSALLECRANLWNSMGFSGNQLMLQLVTDGLKLTPTDPNLVEARDAILQADLVNNAGANLGDLWAGFAKRGLGENASSPAGGGTTTGVVEDFGIPSFVTFQFPNGIPDQLLPDQLTTFDVNIDGFGGTTPTPGTGLLFVSINGGSFSSSPMTQNAPNQYTATLPASSCFDQVSFYVSTGTSGGTATSPNTAPADAYEALVFTDLNARLVDDFETDQGWIVTDSAGLVEGSWERGEPLGNDRGDPPADSDGSGQCYLTMNDPLDTNSDVDDGSTTLTSPVFDMSEGGTITYDYWLNDIPSGEIGVEDGLAVEVATNVSGTNWVQLRNYTVTQPVWRTDTIQVGTEVPATSTVRIRFIATEVDPGDVLEAGIDAILATGPLQCSETSSTFCDASDGADAQCPCAAGNPDAGCDIAQGTGGVSLGVLAQETSPQNRVTMQGTGYPVATAPAAVVIRAPSLDVGSPVVFGDGLRCIATPLVRLGGAVASSGTSVHTFGHGTAAGTGTFYYQIWFRNTPISFCDPTAAFNLSNGGSLDW